MEMTCLKTLPFLYFSMVLVLGRLVQKALLPSAVNYWPKDGLIFQIAHIDLAP